MKTVKLKILLIALLLQIAALGLLITADWRIALGVFLFTWSNNLADGKQ